MRRTGPLLLGVLLLGATIAPIASAQEASPPSPIRLVDSRRIELPGVRILSMSPDGGSIDAANGVSDIKVIPGMSITTLSGQALGSTMMVSPVVAMASARAIVRSASHGKPASHFVRLSSPAAQSTWSVGAGGAGVGVGPPGGPP